MTITFALIGLRIHSHGGIREVLDAGDTRLVAIADNDETLRQEAASRYNVPVYENYLELLERERPDLAIVCPIHGQKAQISLECLSRGIHVLCDKPMAISEEDLAALEAEINSGKAEFQMMLTERFGPSFVRLKELADAGEFGEIAGFVALRPHELGPRAFKTVPWLLDPAQSGGVIVDLIIHDIDLIRWYSRKEVVQVSAWHHRALYTGEQGYRDIAHALFVLEDGIPATVETDYLTPRATPWDCRFFLTGTRGAAEIKSLGFNELIVWTENNPHRKIELAPARTDSSGQDLVRRIRGQSPQILQAADAIAATRAVLAARKAAETNSVVSLNAASL